MSFPGSHVPLTSINVCDDSDPMLLTSVSLGKLRQQRQHLARKREIADAMVELRAEFGQLACNLRQEMADRHAGLRDEIDGLRKEFLSCRVTLPEKPEKSAAVLSSEVSGFILPISSLQHWRKWIW